MYNWSKERSEKLIKQATNLGTWLSSRSTLFSNIIMQKLGIFHHQPTPQSYDTDSSAYHYCQITDIESLAKFSHVTIADGKEWSRTAGNRPQNSGKIGSNQQSWDRVSCHALRDVIPNPHYPQNIVDPVVKAAYDLQDVYHREKKSKGKIHRNLRQARNASMIITIFYCICFTEELTRLHAMWEGRVSAPNIPISAVNLNAFKQHSRLIHYCHTPLLFLPQWRLQSAATRDHSLTPAPTILPNNLMQPSQNPWKSANNSEKSLTEWHQELCVQMLSEYKQYLQVLGFNPIQIDPGQQT